MLVGRRNGRETDFCIMYRRHKHKKQDLKFVCAALRYN